MQRHTFGDKHIKHISPFKDVERTAIKRRQHYTGRQRNYSVNCKMTTCKGFNEILVSRQRIGYQAHKIISNTL